MAGKRQAASDLNHLNWDRVEEPEEVGLFQTASEEEIKNRVIKKARRKLPEMCATDAVNEKGTQVKNVFSGFSGFAKTAPSTPSTSGAFSFLSKIPAVASNATSTTNINKTIATSKSPEQKIVKNYEFEKSNTYYAKLKGLNHAVTNWIKMHIDKNPLCILTPIFKDYENYLNEIEKDEKDVENAPTSSIDNIKKSRSDLSQFKIETSSISNAPTSSSKLIPTFSFCASSVLTTSTVSEPCTTSSGTKIEQIKSNGFSFGLKTDEKPSGSGNQSYLNFNQASSTSTTTTTTTTNDNNPSSTVFSFSNSKPFTFANVAGPVTTAVTTNEENDDEENQPPKVEFKPVVEEDAIYSKRCKLFIKIEGEFSDRGVGMLYLKPVKETNKTQLLMRADTNLGNILVNLILNESIPTQKMGKNNVMLVCVPTPEMEKATPILLRVKTSEEADDLLKIIEKYKKNL